MKSECKRRNASAFRGPRLFLLSILAMAAVTFAPIIAAQSTGGRIRGTVSDPSGAAVVSAKVTLINEATNVSRDVDTGANGDFSRESENKDIRGHAAAGPVITKPNGRAHAVEEGAWPA